MDCMHCDNPVYPDRFRHTRHQICEACEIQPRPTRGRREGGTTAEATPYNTIITTTGIRNRYRNMLARQQRYVRADVQAMERHLVEAMRNRQANHNPVGREFRIPIQRNGGFTEFRVAEEVARAIDNGEPDAEWAFRAEIEAILDQPQRTTNELLGEDTAGREPEGGDGDTGGGDRRDTDPCDRNLIERAYGRRME